MVSFVMCLLASVWTASSMIDSSSSTNAFPILKVNQLLCSHPVFSASVMPGERLPFQIVDLISRQAYTVKITAGALIPGPDRGWEWIAPMEPGIYPITIQNYATKDSLLLNCIVLVPASRMQNGYLNNYRIGFYPVSKDSNYAPPRGFIEVTEENQSTRVSPHFTLADFVCRDNSPFPKYLPLKHELVYKLEGIIDELNRRGIPCTRIEIMNGYRTPHRNRGNAPFSRHIYGAAADLFVDSDGDGRMDDLNGDGVSNAADARYLYRLVDSMKYSPLYGPLGGGLGLYTSVSHRTPFIHIDVRNDFFNWVGPYPGKSIAAVKSKDSVAVD